MSLSSHFGNKSAAKSLQKLIKKDAKLAAKESGEAFKGINAGLEKEARAAYQKENGKIIKDIDQRLNADTFKFTEEELQYRKAMSDQGINFSDAQYEKQVRRDLSGQRKAYKAREDAYVRDYIEEHEGNIKSDIKGLNKKIYKEGKATSEERLKKTSRYSEGINKLNNMSEEEYDKWVNENVGDNLKDIVRDRNNLNKVARSYQKGSAKGTAIKGALAGGAIGATIGSSGATQEDETAGEVQGAAVGAGVAGLGTLMLARSISRFGR